MWVGAKLKGINTDLHNENRMQARHQIFNKKQNNDKQAWDLKEMPTTYRRVRAMMATCDAIDHAAQTLTPLFSAYYARITVTEQIDN